MSTNANSISNLNLIDFSPEPHGAIISAVVISRFGQNERRSEPPVAFFLLHELNDGRAPSCMADAAKARSLDRRPERKQAEHCDHSLPTRRAIAARPATQCP